MLREWASERPVLTTSDPNGGVLPSGHVYVVVLAECAYLVRTVRRTTVQDVKTEGNTAAPHGSAA